MTIMSTLKDSASSWLLKHLYASLIVRPRGQPNSFVRTHQSLLGMPSAEFCLLDPAVEVCYSTSSKSPNSYDFRPHPPKGREAGVCLP